jgi:hypothetical protein
MADTPQTTGGKTMNCGCKIIEHDWKDPVIEFCPLHAHAEEMRGFLKLYLDGSPTYADRVKAKECLAAANGGKS